MKVACMASAVAVLLLGNCDQSERNVILGKAPFYTTTIPHESSDSQRIISSVHQFAEAKGMDFLLSRDGPDLGDYNVTAAGKDLNFKVMHVRVADGAKTKIMAYSRTEPTEADQKQVKEFVCIVRGDCRT